MKNNFKILLISLLLLGGLSLVNAWTGPSSSPTAGNTKSPLTASDSNQYKEGKLAINKSSSPILYDLEVVGNILASGFATSGGINMTGDIKTDSLTHSSSNQVKVCVTSSGVLEKCTTTPVVLSYGGMSSAQAFSIPLNVKNDKITVEMWGAGAGGGKVSVGNYSEVAAQDGGDSYFAKGSTFSVIAKGGDANKDGGDYIDPTNSNLTYLSRIKGGDGTFASGDVTGNINSNCAAGSGIYIWKGGYGQTGGSGGFSGPGGATVPTGGSGGSGGDVSSLTCSSHETIEGSYGSVGINASSVGIGGSGWGGRGGYSGVDEDPTSRLYEEGSLGPNGGGGGAYVKFEVVVSSGESYNFFVGRGGEGGKLICPQQGCDPEWNYISGNGADGLIKISYEIE